MTDQNTNRPENGSNQPCECDNGNNNPPSCCGCGQGQPPQQASQSPCCGDDGSTMRAILMLIALIALVAGAWYYSTTLEKPKPKIEVPTVSLLEMTKPLEQVELLGWVNATQPITPAELQGKVTLVEFWATWCPPCRKSFPEMIEIREEMKDQPNFQFVAVSMDDPTVDSRAAIEAFLKQYEAPDLPVYMDPDAETMMSIYQNLEEAGAPIDESLYGAIPFPLLLDQEGRIRAAWMDENPDSDPYEQMRQAIDELLADDDSRTDIKNGAK